MKKVILCLAASLFVALGIYAQESKPVIGLTEIGFVNGQTVPQDYKNVEIQVRAAFSSSKPIEPPVYGSNISSPFL